MQLPETETGSPGPYWEMEEHTFSVPIPQLTGTVLSRNPRILVSRGNPSSYVRDAGNGSTPSAQPDWQT